MYKNNTDVVHILYTVVVSCFFPEQNHFFEIYSEFFNNSEQYMSILSSEILPSFVSINKSRILFIITSFWFVNLLHFTPFKLAPLNQASSLICYVWSNVHNLSSKPISDLFLSFLPSFKISFNLLWLKSIVVKLTA